MGVKGFIEAHQDFCMCMVALLVIVLISVPVIWLLHKNDIWQEQQYIEHCMAIVETTAEKCLALRAIAR